MRTLSGHPTFPRPSRSPSLPRWPACYLLSLHWARAAVAGGKHRAGNVKGPGVQARILRRKVATRNYGALGGVVTSVLAPDHQFIRPHAMVPPRRRPNWKLSAHEFPTLCMPADAETSSVGSVHARPTASGRQVHGSVCLSRVEGRRLTQRDQRPVMARLPTFTAHHNHTATMMQGNRGSTPVALVQHPSNPGITVGFLSARLPPGHARHRGAGPARIDLPDAAFQRPCAADHRLRLRPVMRCRQAPPWRVVAQRQSLPGMIRRLRG